MYVKFITFLTDIIDLIFNKLSHTIEDFRDAIRLLKEKPESFEKLVTHVFPLEEAGKAFEILDKRSEPAVKILLRSE